jgi:CBS domain-containing protein
MATEVKDVMTTRVVSVRKDASFKAMAAALREHRVSALPVVDADGTVIGIVSETDMLVKEVLAGQEGMAAVLAGLLHHKDLRKARGATAGDLMTSPAVTAAPDDTAEDAARRMYRAKVRRLPVVDSGGRLVGIVTRADLLAVFSRPDSEIRREIAGDLIVDRFITAPDRIMVAVKDGVVTLAGIPESYEAGREFVREIRHIPGVVAVRDRLTYPPPGHGAGPFDVLADFPAD